MYFRICVLIEASSGGCSCLYCPLTSRIVQSTPHHTCAHPSQSCFLFSSVFSCSQTSGMVLECNANPQQLLQLISALFLFLFLLFLFFLFFFMFFLFLFFLSLFFFLLFLFFFLHHCCVLCAPPAHISPPFCSASKMPSVLCHPRSFVVCRPFCCAQLNTNCCAIFHLLLSCQLCWKPKSSAASSPGLSPV